MAGIPAAVLSVMVQAQGIDRTARELNRIHTQAQQANRGLEGVERQAKRTGDATTELNQRFTRLDRTVGDFNRTMMGLRNVVSLIRWPALIAGAGLAAKAIDALAAGAIGLVSALGPLVGLGAAAGVGLTALAQGAGTVKLAFADLGKALGGNKKALQALTPAQRQFLGELKAMQGQLKQLKQAAAAGMFPGLTQALKNLTPLFGPLRGVIAATGKEFGNLAVQASRSMQGWGSDLQRIGGTNVKIIHNLGLGAISLANAFRSLVVAGGPLATWMSQVARGWADWINKQVQAGRESGRLAGFLDRTRQVMTQLGHIGGNLAVTLFNIGKAASPLGRSLMGTLEGVTRKWREWTGSITGQNAMRKYFDDAKPGILAIGGLVGDLAKAFVRLGQGPGLAGMVGKLRELVPVLENVIATTTAALGPVLLDAIGNLVRLIGQLAGTSGALNSFVRMLGWMAGALADLLTNNPMLSAMVVNLVAFGGALKAMRVLFSPLTSGIAALIATWGKVTGNATLAQSAQQRATVAAEAAGTAGAASVSRLAAAWAGVGAAAGRAAGAGAAAGATGIRSVGAATTGGVLLPPGPTARGLGTAETATVSKFQGLTGKLSAVANTAMRGIGIGVGGIVATSIASTLVGGGAGKWIQAIGTGASLGGALGSIFGPAGAAGGAVIGGLVGSVAKFIGDHANAQGKQWADGFLAPFGPAVDKKVRDRLADDYKQMQDAQDRAKAPALPTPSARFPLPPRPADMAQRKTEDFNAIFNTQYKTGADAAQKWISEFGAVRIKTMPAFVMDARLALDSLPVYAQQSAAKQMILYAQSLQANGQLPKGAVNQIIQSIQGRYAALGPWLAAQGLANSQQVAATMKFDGAVKNLVATQNQMRAQFGLWSSDPVITGKNYIRNLKSEFDQLQWIAATTTGKAHDAAVAGMRRLHTDTVKILDAQLSDVQTKFAGMKASIATNTAGAATAAGKGFYGVWWNIDQAMRSSVISTNEGGKRVSKALVSLLEAFGSTKIPKAVIDQTTWAASAFPAMWGGKQGTQGGQASPRGHARGGLTQIGLPGQRGLDTVPLNVGGMPIKVAPGEQVAVFNHDQQMVANAALAPMGGLPGLFSKVHRPHHTMASGGFVPGFQTGGTPRGTAIPGFYTQAQLAQLWAQANPGLGDPRLMAAIAMAESGGNSQIVNSIGASGLWQIHPPEPGVLDPMTNARIAGRKLRTQGLRAWEAYTNGAYRQFLGGAAAGPMGAMPVAPKIPTPKVAGGGTMAQVVRGGLGKVTDAANAYIANAMGSIAGAIGGGGGGLGAAGAKGLGNFDGLRVANWIIPILDWARSHGWGGRITSGYRPGGGSEHGLIDYPGGAVDVGWNTSIAEGTALHNVLQGYPGRPNLLWGGQYISGYTDPRGVTAPGGHDYGHFSGTGRQRGGMVANYAGAFAQGGAVTATSPTLALFGEHGPETAMFVPHFQGGGIASAGGALTAAMSLAPPTLMGKTIGQWWNPPKPPGGGGAGGGGGAAAASWQQTILGEPGPLPLPVPIPTTLAGVNSAITTAEGVNSTIVQLQSKYGTLGNFFDLSSETLLDPTTGAVNADQVQQRVGELQQLEDIARQIWEAYQKYIAWIQLISEGYKAVIAKMQTEMATVTQQESRLQTRLRSITDVILPRLRKMRDAIHLGGLKGAALTSAKSHQAQIRAAIATYGDEQTADKTGIANLEKRKTALRETITTATGGRDQYAGTLISEAGNRDSAWIDYLRIQGEKAGVAGTQAQPVAGAGGAGGAGGVDTAALQTLLAQANQRTAVSQAQYAVLQNWPPKYLGRAAAGGMVTVGERGPELVSLPVGASVYPNSAYQNATQPIEVHVHVHDGAVDPNKIQVIAEGAAMRVTRGQARSGSAASRLPGSRGGI